MGDYERFETARLRLRRPRPEDSEAIFSRYSGDREVTRYLSWARHDSVESARAFLDFSEAEWARWPAGPYLIESRQDGRLMGGTGFGFETEWRASTGYVLARDCWGQGFATEALAGIVAIGRGIGIVRLEALCHADHRASWRVLEKCGFIREGLLRRHSVFPNLGVDGPCDVFCYGIVLG
jgi:ribosomal-protein-alanine N-acetyltransferase